MQENPDKFKLGEKIDEKSKREISKEEVKQEEKGNDEQDRIASKESIRTGHEDGIQKKDLTSTNKSHILNLSNKMEKRLKIVSFYKELIWNKKDYKLKISHRWLIN